MKLYYSKSGDVICEHGSDWILLPDEGWDQLVNREGLHPYLMQRIQQGTKVSPLEPNMAGAPICNQEVWAAGVTYLRSKEARMQEAQDAGGGDFYDRVYDAARPELFFKATPARTVGPGEQVFLRRDSNWNVPEPELTLFCSSHGTIEGYTIGNDMSSRSIEGENPLYLPQAKSYTGSAALGPCLYVPSNPISLDTQIEMSISRNGVTQYQDDVSLRMMKRTFAELVEYLFRECDFPLGVYLMTGTCLVPDDDFTLEVGDEVHITIEPIGTLKNTVSRR